MNFLEHIIRAGWKVTFIPRNHDVFFVTAVKNGVSYEVFDEYSIPGAIEKLEIEMGWEV